LRTTHFGWGRPHGPGTTTSISISGLADVAGLLEAQLWNMAAPRWQRASAEERPHLFAQASLRAWIDRNRWLGPD